MKPWYRSKTLWVNGLVLLDTGASWITGHSSLLQATGLTTNQQVAVLMICNGILRLVTSAGLTLKGSAS